MSPGGLRGPFHTHFVLFTYLPTRLFTFNLTGSAFTLRSFLAESACILNFMSDLFIETGYSSLLAEDTSESEAPLQKLVFP